MLLGPDQDPAAVDVGRIICRRLDPLLEEPKVRVLRQLDVQLTPDFPELQSPSTRCQCQRTKRPHQEPPRTAKKRGLLCNTRPLNPSSPPASPHSDRCPGSSGPAHQGQRQGEKDTRRFARRERQRDRNTRGREEGWDTCFMSRKEPSSCIIMASVLTWPGVIRSAPATCFPSPVVLIHRILLRVRSVFREEGVPAQPGSVSALVSGYRLIKPKRPATPQP